MKGSKTALVILDAQVNMFAEGSSVFQAERLLMTIAGLVARSRRAGIPVIFVQNNGTEGAPDMPGTPGWQIHPALAPAQTDIVIQKHTPDAFFETNLQRELSRRKIRRLVIAGFQTDLCIDATCHRAAILGYDVILVRDGHSTFDSDGITAGQIIEQYNLALRPILRLVSSGEIHFE